MVIVCLVLGYWVAVFVFLGCCCLVLGCWFLVLGGRFLVVGVWFLVLGSGFLVLGPGFLVRGSWSSDVFGLGSVSQIADPLRLFSHGSIWVTSGSA